MNFNSLSQLEPVFPEEVERDKEGNVDCISFIVI